MASMAHNKVLPSSPCIKNYPDDPKTEILEAAKSGDVGLLNAVLEELSSGERTSVLAVHDCIEPMPDDETWQGYAEVKKSPLIVAVENGNLDCVKVLLKYKADIDGHGNVVCFERDDYFVHNCCTPLYVSAAYGNVDILSFLVENGADVNASTNSQCTPLMIATKCNHTDTVAFLIDQGANVNLQDDDDYTALHHAVEASNFDALRCLINGGANVNACAVSNWTPLMLACEFNNVKVVDCLLQHGAKVSLQDNRGETALCYAVNNGCASPDILSSLIKYGACINSSNFDNRTPLMMACYCGSVNKVNFLLQNGAKVGPQDYKGYTALCYAIQNVYLSECTTLNILISLLKYGANVNTAGHNKCTPLMLACQLGCDNVNTVNALLQNGATVDPQDKDGQTAFFHATNSPSGSSTGRLSSLLENGAEVNASRNDKCTPLMKASSNGNAGRVAWLIEHGANVHLEDSNGNTALHYATRKPVYKGKTESFITLLAAGASFLCENSQGLTPLLAASNNGNIEVVEYLLKHAEVKKEQRIDALELLGTFLSTDDYNADVEEGFKFICRGMKERYADPSHPLLKQQMEPVEAYQNRKESQTLEELALIDGDRNAIIMESLIIRERIFGRNNKLLLQPIRYVADKYENLNGLSTCIGLYRHAMKIAQSCDQSPMCDLSKITSLLHFRVEKDLHTDDGFVELVHQTILDYDHDIQRQLMKGPDIWLFKSLFYLIKMVSQFKCCEGKFSWAEVLLQNLCKLNPRDFFTKDTLLHEFVNENQICSDTSHFYIYVGAVKLLLNAGFDVNAINKKGDIPLHFAVTLKPSIDNIHLLCDMLQVLLDRGAHHDFVNNDGKTPMDLAQTDTARMILSERKKMELKCISARAVKRFGIDTQNTGEIH